MRTTPSSYRSLHKLSIVKPPNRFQTRPKSCPLCKQAGRGDFHHYLNEWTNLPDTDRKFIEKARPVVGIFDCHESEEEPQDYQPEPTKNQPTPYVLRIQARQYPYLDTFYRHGPVSITMESGATGNMICLSTIQKLKVEICKSAQSAYQGDGSSPLKVIGETFPSLADNMCSSVKVWSWKTWK